jgi:chromosome segregation ATPase
MNRKRLLQTVLVVFTIIAASAVANAVARAQSPAPAGRLPQPADPALNAILLELRALRGDLAAANQRTMTAQLLLGRLQMQEQRIAYLDGQRTQKSAKLTETSMALRAMSEGMAGVSNCGRAGDAEARRACDERAAELKRMLAPMTAAEQQLRVELADLESAVATEQGRWTEFNQRLDALEQLQSPR